MVAASDFDGLPPAELKQQIELLLAENAELKRAIAELREEIARLKAYILDFRAAPREIRGGSRISMQRDIRVTLPPIRPNTRSPTHHRFTCSIGRPSQSS